MSAPKHTPGPHVVAPSRYGFAFDIRAEAFDATLACIYPPEAWLPDVASERVSQIKANADLFAGASGLADALVEAVEDMHHELDVDEEHEIPAQTQCGACGENESPCTNPQCWVYRALAALAAAGRKP